VGNGALVRSIFEGVEVGAIANAIGHFKIFETTRKSTEEIISSSISSCFGDSPLIQ
jgi:hypothetical protein